MSCVNQLIDFRCLQYVVSILTEYIAENIEACVLYIAMTDLVEMGILILNFEKYQWSYGLNTGVISFIKRTRILINTKLYNLAMHLISNGFLPCLDALTNAYIFHFKSESIF